MEAPGSGPDCSWCPLHRTCVDCLSASAETYPAILNPILKRLGFHIVDIMVMFWACLQQVPVWPIPKLWPQRLQLGSGSYSAEKNLTLLQRVHIKSAYLPAPLCSGLCISWCLDTYRSLNKEACQRGASLNREIIQTVRHRLIKTSSPFTALVLH